MGAAASNNNNNNKEAPRSPYRPRKHLLISSKKKLRESLRARATTTTTISQQQVVVDEANPISKHLLISSIKQGLLESPGTTRTVSQAIKAIEEGVNLDGTTHTRRIDTAVSQAIEALEG